MSTGIKTYDQLFLRHNLDKDAHKDLFDKINLDIQNIYTQLEAINNKLDIFDSQIKYILDRLSKCVFNEVYFADKDTGDIFRVYFKERQMQVEFYNSKVDCKNVYLITMINKSDYINHLVDLNTGDVYKLGYDGSDFYVEVVNYEPRYLVYYAILKDNAVDKYYKVTMESGNLVYTEITGPKSSYFEFLMFNDDTNSIRYKYYIENGELVFEDISEAVSLPDYVSALAFRFGNDDYKLSVDNNHVVMEQLQPDSYRESASSVNIVDSVTNEVKKVHLTGTSYPVLTLDTITNYDTYYHGIILPDKNDPKVYYKLTVESNNVKLERL